MEPTMNISQAAKLIGCKVKTMQGWDRKGKLKPYRSGTNRRYYTESQIRAFLGIPTATEPTKPAVK
jgi:DNA-binding transcriptional MerR regulator